MFRICSLVYFESVEILENGINPLEYLEAPDVMIKHWRKVSKLKITDNEINHFLLM